MDRLVVLRGLMDRVLGLVLRGLMDRVLGLVLGGVTDRVLGFGGWLGSFRWVDG